MKKGKKLFDMSKALYKGNFRYLAGFVSLISIISVLMALIDPIILRIVFDALESGESMKVFRVCIQASVITAIFFVLCYIQNCYCDIWLYRLIGNGNSKSFINYHALPYGEKRSQYEEGDALNRINTGVEGLAYMWLFLSLIVSNVISSLFISALALTTSLWIIVLASVLFLFTFLRTWYQSKKNMVFSVRQQELGGIREGNIHTLVYEMEFLVMTGTYELIKSRYTVVRDKIWDIDKKRVYLSVWLDALEEAVKGTFRALLAFLLFPLKNKAAISTGQLVSSFSMYDSLYNNLCFLRRPVTTLPQQLVPIRSLNEMLGLHRDSQKAVQGEERISVPVIDIKNVTFKQGDKEILKEISLEIYRGQKVAIIGHNGCGKSTLLRVILGLYAPASGYSAIMGKNSAQATNADIRSLVSFIPSCSQLFAQSARWNIESGAEDEELGNVERIAEMLMIKQETESFLTKNAAELSGGQAQRTNIARAMIHKTQVILADEPGASLDNQMGETIIQQIISGAETVLAITHHPSQLKYFDRVIIMEYGRITADLTVDELQGNSSYNQWLGVWNTDDDAAVYSISG